MWTSEVPLKKIPTKLKLATCAYSQLLKYTDGINHHIWYSELAFHPYCALFNFFERLWKLIFTSIIDQWKHRTGCIRSNCGNCSHDGFRCDMYLSLSVNSWISVDTDTWIKGKPIGHIYTRCNQWAVIKESDMFNYIH